MFVFLIHLSESLRELLDVKDPVSCKKYYQEDASQIEMLQTQFDQLSAKCKE